ncbi:hypothetical protein J6590_025556 [Homalodisca vitripennis]|nr:hypothetical protein J6590_025556 [Homalodisca vitripennis]
MVLVNRRRKEQEERESALLVLQWFDLSVYKVGNMSRQVGGAGVPMFNNPVLHPAALLTFPSD